MREFCKRLELLKKYLQAALGEAYVIGMDGNVLCLDRTWRGISGYEREVLLGKNFLTESSLLRAMELFHTCFGGKSTGPGEVTLFGKDGSHVAVEINIIEAQQEGKQVMLALVRDTTMKEKAELTLRETYERLRKISDNLPDSLVYQIVSDEKGQGCRFTYISAGVEQIRGVTVEQALNDATLLYEQIVDEDRHLVKENEAAALKNMSIFNVEVRIRRPSGEIRWVNLIATPQRLSEYQVQWDGVEIDITDRKKNEVSLKQSIERVRKALSAITNVIVATVEARDPFTAGHQRRTADLARSIAIETGLTSDQIEGIHMAGIIHDIGKISIPAEILSKPGRLTEAEFDLVKMHVDTGYNILKRVDFSQPVARIVYEHHERMDGSGYPRRLKGEEMIIESRILAVADVVEAMASHRPYRPALGVNAALGEIEKNREVLYDADVVDACLRLFREKGYQLPDV
ncbi:MAG: HD domain-containing protein [Syntrophales bacterium]|jgi:PAS domain S-box-containing protein/putative nucleotidyltransferase with HDIG domain|nr:HD domain-containing protein [Syntrophales bacterium]MCK9527435.1 HD domain-containing protein [Syntrophales bacterium]MDX9921539.1 HD domain-containing phosphohydrolase [Syntrophales bacterium]